MGRWDPVNWINHTSWEAIVTLTDRPRSVRNRYVIKVFGGVFVLSRCFLDFSVGVGAFGIGLIQISSFSLRLFRTEWHMHSELSSTCIVYEQQLTLNIHCRKRHELHYLSVLLILQSADCEPNPGPRTLKFPCMYLR